MQRKQMVWREVRGLSGARRLYLGEVCVGVVSRNAFKARNEVGVDYRWSCLLPGLKNVLNNTIPTLEDEMHSVQNAVDSWFNKVMEA